MANYERATETVERHSFRLEVPTNLAELDKMVHAAWRDYASSNGLHVEGVSDDALSVSVEDEAIVVWWEVQVRAGTSR